VKVRAWKGILLIITLQICLHAAAQSTTATSPSDDSTANQTSTLDYEVFRTRIQPIFLKKRDNGMMCANCHTVLPTRLRLQPLDPGATAWTEEQTRKNFEVVAKLVTPGDPMHSKLLLHPLAPEAGGDPTHTGGKFWKSVNDPEWQMIAAWVKNASPSAATSTATVVAPVLDYDFFKTQVEPILLEKRPGHARCYSCHKASAEAKKTHFRLELLLPGNTNWTEEQSRENFEVISRYVTPGLPLESRFVMHALAPQAGGDPYHTGGRQFKSQSDPDWKIFAEWARGAKAKASQP
jgi:hypothetical protein